MEDRKVRAIDCVAAVDVAGREEPQMTSAHQLDLVRARVTSQHMPIVDVVRVVATSADVIERREQRVKVLLDADVRIDVVKQIERHRLIGVVLVEPALDALFDDAQRMVGTSMQIHADVATNARRNVAAARRCHLPLVDLRSNRRRRRRTASCDEASLAHRHRQRRTTLQQQRRSKKGWRLLLISIVTQN